MGRKLGQQWKERILPNNIHIITRVWIKWYQSLCGLMCVLEIIKHMWTTYYLRSVTTNNKQGLKKRTNIDGFQHTDLWTSRKMEWLQCMWVGGWSYMIYYCCLLCISLFRRVYLISARGNRRIIQPYRTTGKTTDIEWWRKKHTICWNISMHMYHIHRSTDVINFCISGDTIWYHNI